MTPLQWALLPESARAILRIFNGFKARGQDIFTKQRSLAEMIGCTREQVNRSIGLLERRGFIKKATRHSRFIVYVLLLVSITSKPTRKVTSDGSGPLYELRSFVRGEQPPKKPSEKPNYLPWRDGLHPDLLAELANG